MINNGNYVTEAERNNAYTTLKDHPVEIALFNSTGPITVVWLVVRLYLGFQWAQAGWQKLQNPEWMDGTSLLGFWNNSIVSYNKPHSSVGFDWYAGFLNNLAESHSQSWFAPLVAYAEFLGGIALILGLFTGIAALGLAFMNFNFMLAGSAGVNPLYFLLAMLLVMAWKNAGWWGLDRYVLPLMGTPWHTGALFRKGSRQVSEAENTVQARLASSRVSKQDSWDPLGVTWVDRCIISTSLTGTVSSPLPVHQLFTWRYPRIYHKPLKLYHKAIIVIFILENIVMNTQILVKEWMSSPAQVIEVKTSVGDAYNLMMQKNIRRLPVVEDGRLVGIVTLGDLREARPSPATSLSIYELTYLLTKLTVDQVMTHVPYTVTPATQIQQAARIMLERKVSGLPVVDDNDNIVGVITETDIFRMLLDQWDYFTQQHVDPGLVASFVAEAINNRS